MTPGAIRDPSVAGGDARRSSSARSEAGRGGGDGAAAGVEVSSSARFKAGRGPGEAARGAADSGGAAAAGGAPGSLLIAPDRSGIAPGSLRIAPDRSRGVSGSLPGEAPGGAGGGGLGGVGGAEAWRGEVAKAKALTIAPLGDRESSHTPTHGGARRELVPRHRRRPQTARGGVRGASPKHSMEHRECPKPEPVQTPQNPRRRAPHYVSDWTEGHNAKTTASIFFMFFTSIAPAITFAELLDRSTGKIGVVEVCLSSCLSGCIFSIFGGQPLVIVGVTGPVTILTISIYGMAKALGISFLRCRSVGAYVGAYEAT